MRVTRSSRLLAIGLTAGLLGGCGSISVEMTSTPERVQFGDPVTFDLKLTNRSQCPTEPPRAELVAFIPVEDFELELIGDLPPDPPDELLELVEFINTFFDELCAGGNPTTPDMAVGPSSCTRGSNEVLCTITGAAPAQQEPTGSLSFATIGNRLRCAIDDGSLSCQLRLPLPQGGTGEASGSAALVMPQTLDCETFPEGSEASCAVGSLQAPIGLAGGQMATGQVVLPARGAGPMRNLVIVFQDDIDEMGVCKGGPAGGDPCDRNSALDCPSSTCGEGICQSGGNDGLGCDESTAAMDCPDGACVECDDFDEPGLPIDCTQTYVAPQTAPAASPWGLAGLTVGLGAAGMWLVGRRLRRHQA